MQHLRYGNCRTIPDCMVIIFIKHNRCRNNANLFCQLLCGYSLECPVVAQICSRCAAILVALVLIAEMDQNFALRVVVCACVIEDTIGKPT